MVLSSVIKEHQPLFLRSWVQYSGPTKSGACRRSQHLGDGGRRLSKFKVILDYLVSSETMS